MVTEYVRIGDGVVGWDISNPRGPSGGHDVVITPESTVYALCRRERELLDLQPEQGFGHSDFV